MGIKDQLRRVDNHSTISSEFRVHTSSGALLSAITLAVIFMLVKTELAFNMRVDTVTEVHVNASSPDALKMEFDVTFHNLACGLISVDAADPTGQPQSLHLDKTHRIHKHRIDKDGKRIGRRSPFELGDTLTHEHELEKLMEEKRRQMMAEAEEEDSNTEKEIEDNESGEEEFCGSCYGAGDVDECCNTCDDVKRAYQRRGWQLEDLSLIKQCKHLKKSDEEAGEGCNISGFVALSTGGGNVHFVPGRSLENFGHEKELGFSDFLLSTFETYNVSHTINKLKFGRSIPGQEYQLDGESRIIQDVFGMYQYYINVVPTTFSKLKQDPKRPYKSKIETFQFSVTEHMRHVSPGAGRGLPGVYFFYEVSPLHVSVRETRRGFIRFFTSIVGVVGGIFTFMGMVDKYVHMLSRRNNNRSSHLGY